MEEKNKEQQQTATSPVAPSTPVGTPLSSPAASPISGGGGGGSNSLNGSPVPPSAPAQKKFKVVLSGNQEGKGYSNENSNKMKTVLLLTYTNGMYPADYITKPNDIRKKVSVPRLLLVVI